MYSLKQVSIAGTPAALDSSENTRQTLYGLSMQFIPGSLDLEQPIWRLVSHHAPKTSPPCRMRF